MTIIYALDLSSSKLWIAEQLDSVASRYLSRNARIIAQQVRQTIPGNQEPNVDNTIRPNPPIQEKIVIQNRQSSPGLVFQVSNTAEIDCYASLV